MTPDVPWVAKHCIQCFKYPSECRICGCHDRPETGGPQPNTSEV